MSLAHPYLLLVPLIYLALRTPRLRRPRAADFSSASILRDLPKSSRLVMRGPVLWGLSAVSAILMGIAAARPQHITILEQPEKGRNIMLVVDASRSMSAKDFPASFGSTSRMEGVKSVVAEYVRTRTQDRVGLVVFGNSAYLQSPLTSDTLLVEELVKSMRPGMAGDGTAIGDGLGVALKRLREIKGASKAIILMTDGVNNAGQVSPIKAAQIAHDLGIQIHTIGIGAGTTPLGDHFFGGLMGIPGGPVAEFDEATLKEIAKMTGGVYFNASSLDGFKEVYKKIEKLTETDDRKPAKTVVQELYVPFAATALACYLLTLLLASTVFLKVP